MTHVVLLSRSKLPQPHRKSFFATKITLYMQKGSSRGGLLAYVNAYCEYFFSAEKGARRAAEVPERRDRDFFACLSIRKFVYSCELAGCRGRLCGGGGLLSCEASEAAGSYAAERRAERGKQNLPTCSSVEKNVGRFF